MAAKEKLTWSNGKVGYDPGQSQSLTVSFKKRNEKKVTVSVSYWAKSLGVDSYTISQRWNKATIYIYRRDSKGNNDKLLESHTWKYQIHGSGGTTSHNDTFTFTAKNGETTFNVYYDNMRQGTNTPWYGPKSTGDTSTEYGHDKIKIGVLKVDDNVKVKVNYYTGGLNEANIKDFPADTEIYKGNDYTVSKKTPTHKYYTFRGGYDKTDKWKKDDSGKERKVNTTKPSVNSGDTVKDVDSTLKLWACWTPKVYNYRFYTDDTLKTELKYLAQTRKYGDDPKKVPDLNPKNGVTPEGYKPGYTHIGWRHYLDSKIQYHKVGGEGCDANIDVKSWPVWEAKDINLTFNYGFDDLEDRGFKYTFGDNFNCLQACVNSNGDVVDPTLIKPGFKLIGWKTSIFMERQSIINPDVLISIFPPGECTGMDYVYKYDYNGVIVSKTAASNYSKGITLYAVWEYCTPLYVYTSKGSSDGIPSWKLVKVPYVRTTVSTDSGKHYTLKWVKTNMSIYTPESNPSWKV